MHLMSRPMQALGILIFLVVLAIFLAVQLVDIVRGSGWSKES